MIIKRITLKFKNHTKTIQVISDTEVEFSAQMARILKNTGAYGYSTQSRVILSY